MSTVTLRSSDPSVRAILRAAFPGENPREVTAEISETIAFWGTNWDSGNHRAYVAVDLATMRAVPLPQDPNWIQGSEAYRHQHPIPDGMVIAVHVHSGMRQFFRIVGNSRAVSGMLPAPVELSPAERIVLCAIRSLKSSYGGIANYRLHEATQYTGIVQEQWDSAKSSLIDRKLLNKAGAITPEGRNAIGDTQLHELRDALRQPLLETV